MVIKELRAARRGSWENWKYICNTEYGWFGVQPSGACMAIPAEELPWAPWPYDERAKRKEIARLYTKRTPDEELEKFLIRRIARKLAARL